MARYRQVLNKETGKYQLIPVDDAAVRKEAGVSLHTAFEPFVSPVDGTIVNDRKSLREHNKRNNVVNTSEFSEEFFERKRKERERLFKGEHTAAESQQRKEQMHELINHMERRG